MPERSGHYVDIVLLYDDLINRFLFVRLYVSPLTQFTLSAIQISFLFLSPLANSDKLLPLSVLLVTFISLSSAMVGTFLITKDYFMSELV